jgi:hypothetical protein
MMTCDDQRVPRPATGKTPVRNARIPDDVWLPALAKAELEGRSASDAMTEALRRYAAEPAAAAYEFTLANWPGAAQWGSRHAEALDDLRGDLGVTIAEDIELIPAEWLAIAAWLASTHHPGDVAQQKRVITGHVLRRLMAQPEGPHRDRFRDSRHLSESVQAILERHLPLGAGE